MPHWNPQALRPTATGISASRRTDIPALFSAWFEQRLKEGFAEYIPAGPPRRLRRSLRPEDVTHFTFWTKWPRPFFKTLETVLERGYPVLWNATVTGLGGTDVEPAVPAWQRTVAAVRELSGMVGAEAILWRYDPIFLTSRYDEGHHLDMFVRIGEQLRDHVDRVAVSFVVNYGRRVRPDLKAWEAGSGDRLADASVADQVRLVGRLRHAAAQMGLPLTLCCSPEVRAQVGCERSNCNNFDWARRVRPELNAFKKLKPRPTRPDCGCSQEADIGVYDTCVLGCRYSYGSCNQGRARSLFQRHDPMAPCLLPEELGEKSASRSVRTPTQAPGS